MERKQLLEKIIIEAGDEIMKLYGKKHEMHIKTNDENFATEADIRSESLIINSIKKHFPKDGIISEESSDYNIKSDYVWVIDPLDGTWNFANGIPIFSVLIAVIKKDSIKSTKNESKKDEVILGGAYFPYMNDFYFAEKGKGAYKNKIKITCSDKTNLDNARGTGFVQLGGEYKKQMLKFSKAMADHRMWHTEFGCGAYDMMLVASGKSHYFITQRDNLWDVAAPSIILKEAGCRVTYINNEDWVPQKDTDMITANPQIHKQIMNIIGK
jgi:myo-inositol-1(or 4)-monophosphatase